MLWGYRGRNKLWSQSSISTVHHGDSIENEHCAVIRIFLLSAPVCRQYVASTLCKNPRVVVRCSAHVYRCSCQNFCGVVSTGIYSWVREYILARYKILSTVYILRAVRGIATANHGTLRVDTARIFVNPRSEFMDVVEYILANRSPFFLTGSCSCGILLIRSIRILLLKWNVFSRAHWDNSFDDGKLLIAPSSYNHYSIRFWIFFFKEYEVLE